MTLQRYARLKKIKKAEWPTENRRPETETTQKKKDPRSRVLRPPARLSEVPFLHHLRAPARRRQLQAPDRRPRLCIGHRRRHAHCAGMGVPVLKMTALERRPAQWTCSRRFRKSRYICDLKKHFLAAAELDDAVKYAVVTTDEVNYVGRNCIGHNYIGHTYTGHNYIIVKYAVVATDEVTRHDRKRNDVALYRRRRRRVCCAAVGAPVLGNDVIVVWAACNSGVGCP